MYELGTKLITLAVSGVLMTSVVTTSAAAQPIPAATRTTSPMSTTASTTTASSTTAIRSALLASLPTLREGSEGGEVLALQVGLDFEGEGAALRGTGYFGPLTRAAVEAFQRDHGLAVDGVVGPRTWNALVDPHYGEPRGFADMQLDPGQAWGAGDPSGAVWLTLDLLHRATDWMPVQAASTPPTYSGALVEGVRAIQQRSGIPDSGILGARTSRVLRVMVALIGHLAA